jgi:hypothetical protein
VSGLRSLERDAVANNARRAIGITPTVLLRTLGDRLG